MIINLFRKLLVGLSFYYKNNLELVKKKDKIILKNIQSRLDKLSQKNPIQSLIIASVAPKSDTSSEPPKLSMS